jgi:hypothetical protein
MPTGGDSPLVRFEDLKHLIRRPWSRRKGTSTAQLPLFTD